MRTRWVSLSTDAAPLYASWAPIMARVWRMLGYQPIVRMHHSEPGVPGWSRPFGVLIERELADAGAMTMPVGPCPPLTMPNVCRSVRVFAAHDFALPDVDFILTADVDMLPLDAAFFDRSEDFIVLRPLYQLWQQARGSTPQFDDSYLQPVDAVHPSPWQVRFPMCYMGATARIWRELVPPTMAEFTARLTVDSLYHDEIATTHAILSSPRVHGHRFEELGPGHWRKGELEMVDPIDRPLLSIYRDMSRGLIRLGDLWRPEHGTPIPDGAIDFIPPRFSGASVSDHPWWAFDVVTMRYPQLNDWLAGYRERLMQSEW